MTVVTVATVSATAAVSVGVVFAASMASAALGAAGARRWPGAPRLRLEAPPPLEAGAPRPRLDAEEAGLRQQGEAAAGRRLQAEAAGVEPQHPAAAAAVQAELNRVAMQPLVEPVAAQKTGSGRALKQKQGIRTAHRGETRSKAPARQMGSTVETRELLRRRPNARRMYVSF
eukprot:tig00021036_g17397.t1